MGFVAQITKFKEKPAVAIAIAAVTIAMAIYSSYMVVSALTLLSAVTDDIGATIENWETVPVASLMTVAAYAGNGCPSDWTPFPTPKFPKVGTGACACPAGATYKGEVFESSVDSCYDNQTSAGCVTDPAQEAIILEQWRNATLCYQRDGDAAVSWAGPYAPRPTPDSAGRCAAGFKACGNGTHNDGAGTCAPAGAPCPLTSAVVVDADVDATSGQVLDMLRPEATGMAGGRLAAPLSDPFDDGSGTALFTVRGSWGDLPIVGASSRPSLSRPLLGRGGARLSFVLLRRGGANNASSLDDRARGGPAARAKPTHSHQPLRAAARSHRRRRGLAAAVTAATVSPPPPPSCSSPDLEPALRDGPCYADDYGQKYSSVSWDSEDGTIETAVKCVKGLDHRYERLDELSQFALLAEVGKGMTRRVRRSPRHNDEEVSSVALLAEVRNDVSCTVV